VFKFDRQCPLPLITQQFLSLTIILQTFTRIDPPTSAADPDTRFNYFTKAVLPSLPQNSSTSTLIFIPSYFDFVQMRNHLHSIPISVGTISEETPVSFVVRAWSHFFTGRHSDLHYSGRGHHFLRYDICAVTSVESYGLPDNSLFYREIASGFIRLSIGEWRVTEQPKACDILQVGCYKLERVIGARGSGLCVRVYGYR